MSTEFAGETTGDTEAGVHALLKRWDDWGEQGTWRRAVAKFQAEDDTQHLAVALKALADVPRSPRWMPWPRTPGLSG